MIKTLCTESVIIERSETNFDKACDESRRMAFILFGINDDGHSYKLKEWSRSSSWIEVEFKSFISNGYNYTYIFDATAKLNVEDEE